MAADSGFCRAMPRLLQRNLELARNIVTYAGKGHITLKEFKNSSTWASGCRFQTMVGHSRHSPALPMASHFGKSRARAARSAATHGRI